MKTIDLETHFYSKAAFEYLVSRTQYPTLTGGTFPGIHYLNFSDTVTLVHDEGFVDTLCDIGKERTQLMDAAGLDTMVMSFSTPGLDECEDTPQKLYDLSVMHNDLLHEAIRNHPGRFGGFAALAVQDVNLALKELERCIRDLGFAGWLTHSSYGDGLFLDNRRYWPLLEAAEAMQIPVYLHPTAPKCKDYGEFGFSLAGPPLGFQSDTALCLVRMIYAGVFDAFPRLRVILGHLGETLPFLVPDRIDWAYRNPGISTLPAFMDLRPNIQKFPSEVLTENVWVTTSGRFSQAALAFTLEVMGEDHVMLATDHPYENLQQSMDFIRDCSLAPGVLEKICAKNAEALGFGRK